MQSPQTTQNVEAPSAIQTSFQGGQHDRDHASLIAQNEYSKGVNVQIRDAGQLKTREGVTASTAACGGIFQDAAWFTPVGGTNVLFQVNDGKFYYWTGSGTAWTRLGTTQLTNNTNPVKIVVCSGILYVFSGTADNVYSWDGITANATDEGNTNTDPGRGDVACTQSGRIITGGLGGSITDYIEFSDIFDGHTYNRSANNQRVPSNSNEPVTAIAMYRKEEILTFTTNSTHLWNISGSTVSNFTRNGIDTSVGCIAQKSVVVVGEDAFFLSSDRHLRTIKRTIQDIAFAVSVPITFDNSVLMGRINKTYASRCAGGYFNNYYLLAAPMDGNIRNSSIIAFDMLHQKQTDAGTVPACCGEWTGLSAGCFITSNFNNVQQFYYIDANDGTAYLMFNGAESDGGNNINVEVVTRAYDFGFPGLDKTSHSGELQLFNSSGVLSIYYAKDDAVFSNFYSPTVGDPTAARLPVTLPFTLPNVLGVSPVFFTMYRLGRSRYWQFEFSHTGGTINIKQFTMRAFVENLTTR